MKSFYKGIVGLLSVLVLSACVTAPQKPVSMADTFWQIENKKVGLVMSITPQPDTFLPGAGCLLCMAAASVANSSLTKHVKTLKVEGMDEIKKGVIEKFKARGVDVVLLPNAIDVNKLPANKSKLPNTAQKSFAQFSDKGLTHLVVIEIGMVGVQRNYADYIPTSSPQGLFSGASYVINLSSNSYESYNPVNVIKGVDGNWDEAPKFPAVTNAYYQALEEGKEKLVMGL